MTRREAIILEEIWKDIPGFPGYQVSDQGRVRCFRDFHGNLTNEFRYLKPLLNKDNYLYVDLYTEDRRPVHKRIHRLVAEAFHGKGDGLVVNHINGDKHDNRAFNLEWTTAERNSTLASKTGLYKTKPIKIVETGEIFNSVSECADTIGARREDVSRCLSGKDKSGRTTCKGLHFELVDEPPKISFLYPHQEQAIDRMFTGCILNGGVGSGKSRTSLYYYFKTYGGSIENNTYKPMTEKPKDLYIITTAQKRDKHEWEGEMVPFLLSPDPEDNLYNNKIVIDSWNNITKYAAITGAFFIFDEDRVTGNGVWVKTFLRIAKANEWIILSASPGDSWLDYIPVFIANGFYRNRTDFCRQHVIYNIRVKFPMVDRYMDTDRLVKLRNKILIDMDFERSTTPHHENFYAPYDLQMYKDTIRTRTNPFKQGYVICDGYDPKRLLVGRDISVDDVQPILDGWPFKPEDGMYVKWAWAPILSAGELCYILRKVVNSSEYRQTKLLEILEDHPRAIIFYNFDYELEILKGLYYGEDVEIAEWNGHKHQPIPKGGKWVYLVQYTAGAEGWNCITTDTIIFYSQNYSYKVLTQAQGRIDRLNTPYKDLYYFHIKSRSGIDLAISKAIADKKMFNEGKFAKW